MEISAELTKLNSECVNAGGKLYIVGGAVRNYMLGLPYADIDICGTLTTDQIMEVASKCGFRSQVVNAKLGTVLITAGNEQYEYTTFRTENYVAGHSPDSVQFVCDIRLDAKRRDFTINAMYYDLSTGEVLDFYEGTKDVKRHIVRTVETPEYVFASDGLRILRLIRFASQLGFRIDKHTFRQARESAYMLRDISGERKLKELKLILFSDFRYGKRNKCIYLFNKLNIYPYLFGFDCKIKRNKWAKLVMGTTLDIRYLCFCVLLLSNKYKFRHMPASQVQFDVNNIWGRGGLRESNANIEDILKLYLIVQQFLYSPTISVVDLVQYNNLDAKLKKCFSMFVQTDKVEAKLDSMRSQGIPLSIDNLDITTEQLRQVISDKHISKVQQALFELCLMGKLSNTYSVLVAKALEIEADLNKLSK